MRYYGIIGTNSITVDCSSNPVCPEGHIEMLSDRPSGEHISQADGSWVKPKPTAEEMQAELRKQLTAIVQGYLDEKVLERGYDSILSACSYAASGNRQFAAEGEVCVVWRDSVWAVCYGVLAQVLSGERQIPTPAELLAELPQLVWPEV